MRKYWFRQKSFGYGASPTTWQGWAFTIVSCLLLFGVVLAGPAIRDNGLRFMWIVGGTGLVLIPTLIIAYRKTEGGWRWRNGRD
jgi:hypothetical protein